MSAKIFVADDDSSILDSIKLILEDAGYSVETSISGEILNKIEYGNHDLVLLDIWMPGEDGRKICRYLKTHPHTSNVPVILISANQDTRKFAKENGADDFLEKPFEIRELLMKVQKHVLTTNSTSL